MKNKFKQHKAVLMLFVRSTMYKIILLFAGMTLIEGFLFRRELNELLEREALRLEELQKGNYLWGDQLFALELVFDGSRILWVFGVFFILLTMLLCSVGCEKGNKQGYMLARLSVSEKGVFLWQSFYNAMCYFMFWAVQLFIVLALCSFYLAKAPADVISNQTVFLAFYRNNLLHSLLPLEDALRWIRNIMMIFSLGIAAAHFPYRQRRGRPASEIMVLAIFSMIWFANGLGSWVTDIVIIVCCIGAAAVAVWRVFSKEEQDEIRYN